MKKAIALAILCTFFALPAFAATLAATADQAGYVLNATAPAATLIAKTSKGVRIGVNYDATNGLGYALSTFHIQGTKVFGTAYDSTALYFQDVGAGYTAFAAPASSVTTAAFGTGWTAM